MKLRKSKISDVIVRFNPDTDPDIAYLVQGFITWGFYAECGKVKGREWVLLSAEEFSAVSLVLDTWGKDPSAGEYFLKKKRLISQKEWIIMPYMATMIVPFPASSISLDDLMLQGESLGRWLVSLPQDYDWGVR
jgi:hypothetical protein